MNIKRSDILSIFIEFSKTDKYRDGAWVVISRTRTSLCPVENLERYLLWADIEEDSDIHIFSTRSACKNGFKIRKCSKVISYTTLRELFVEAVRPHVQDISRYCLHSLRSGRARATARHGIPDKLFKRHGRWVSETAKDGYVKERFKVSQC